MDIDRFLEKDVQDFILGNKSVDIKKLALQKMPFEGELRTQVLNHIHGFQKAKDKLPEWANREGIIFPNPDIVEQSSSNATAEYKASLFPQDIFKEKIFLDLTAGLGSDSYALSKRFASGYCVEADPLHAQALEYNLNILSDKNITILNGYAEDVIQDLPNIDLVYIDPQRRNEGGKRGLYDLSQTSPNILKLLPILKEKSPRILIKTSPYLDIEEGIKKLGGVSEVHVVEHEKQCKEVLYYIDQIRDINDDPDIITARCAPPQIYRSILSETKSALSQFFDPLRYLYEPCPALMKSGAHEVYGHELKLSKLAPMTHLYTSDQLFDEYMGRIFEVIDTLPVKKNAVHAALPDKRANISTRNFSMKPDDLRKKLNLKDGGDHTLFGCTLNDGSHTLVLCKNIAH